MLRPRLIPTLLLKGRGLVKGIGFQNHTYVGDPVNTVQIFNTKQVDEIVFLDITATLENRLPPLDLIQSVSDQCLIPFTVGGGICTVDAAKQILASGAEKVVLGTSAFERPELIREIADQFGSQAVVVSVDYKKGFLGRLQTYIRGGFEKLDMNPLQAAKQAVKFGAGEILLNCIDRDGRREGYDIQTLKNLTDVLPVPVIACGGAGTHDDLHAALHEGRAAAAAAGSLFVHHGSRRAVLIQFPNEKELDQIRRA